MKKMEAAIVGALFGAALLACNAIIGTKDIFFEADGGGSSSSGEGGSFESGATDANGSSSGEAGNSEAGGDANTCGAVLQNDPKNCGRCGHDCFGGQCAKGACVAVTVKAQLGNPNGIAVDAANVYITTAFDGKVIQIGKTDGASKDLATGQTKAQGVVVVGTTLYWSNGDFAYSRGNPTYKGGVWQCTLPACAGAPELVAPGDFAINVQLLNGVAYFSANNDSTIRRSLPDAGSEVVASTNKPFGLGVDTSYAYYTSSQPNLYRAPIGDGGDPESVGPLDSQMVGYVALDATRYYWAYVDSTGVGHVYGGLKADPSSRIEYGTANNAPLGVAVDGTNLYWTCGGNSTSGAPNGDGQLLTCPVTGCPASGPVHLADDLAFGGPIAFDQNQVYWVEYGQDGTSTGRLRRIAKP
jgi:hypothetical protein